MVFSIFLFFRKLYYLNITKMFSYSTIVPPQQSQYLEVKKIGQVKLIIIYKQTWKITSIIRNGRKYRIDKKG